MSKVTEVKVSAFSECFLFYFILYFFLRLHQQATASGSQEEKNYPSTQYQNVVLGDWGGVQSSLHLQRPSTLKSTHLNSMDSSGEPRQKYTTLYPHLTVRFYHPPRTIYRECVLFGFALTGSCRKLKVTLMRMFDTHNSISLWYILGLIDNHECAVIGNYSKHESKISSSIPSL